MLYMKMAFFVGIFLAAPFILWEIWGFISPGLYKNEKKWAVPFIGMGTLFFVGGRPLRPLLPVPDDVPVPRQLRRPGHAVHAARSTSTGRSTRGSCSGLGLVFQIPVVIFVLARLGLVTPGFLLRGWKFAILGSFIISAIITPTPGRGHPDRARRAR